MTERKVAGRYRLLEPIGEGGMGVVWRSHDELLDRIVAVKEVRYRGVDEAARVDLNRRTIREAKTAGRLDHPSVIIVHDVVEEEGRPWIVMQLVRSRSLGEVVRQAGPLSPDRVASVGLHVLGALRAAHAAGVLHRDVKPENVLLADDGRVVLTDFGIASMTQETGITRTGGMVGTPAFLPPERLHGMSATPESDLWSLGATLYAALEGHPPFERPTAAATMMAVLNGEPSPMSHSGPLASAILGLMAREPAARMSADEAEALLTRASADRLPGGAATGDRSAQAGPAAHHGRAPHAGQPQTGQPAYDAGPYGAASYAGAPHNGAPHAGDPHTGAPYGAQAYGSHGVEAYGAAPHAGTPHAGDPYAGNQYAVERRRAEEARYAADARYAGEAPRPAGVPPTAWLPQHGPPQHGGQPPLPHGQGHSPRTGPTHGGLPFQLTHPSGQPHHGDLPHAGRTPATNDPFQSLHPHSPTRTEHPLPGADPFQPSFPDPSAQAGQPFQPAEQPYPGPRTRRGQHASDDDPTSARRRPATRRTALMVGAPVLALAVGVGGWLVLRNLGGEPGDVPTSPTATAAVPGTTVSPSRSPKPSRTSRPTASGRPTQLPDGWQLYRDPLGFSVGMPRGWTTKRSAGRDRVEFRAPGSDAFLWIESTEDPETDPVRHWEKVEKGGLARKLWPGYERVGITPRRYRGLEAADWEFTYLKNGVRTHVLDRGFRTAAGRPYAIYWESPESEWDRTFFDRFTETFRP
ncbi:serine/threonine-protein kinase [Streptosporangium carneum]|uniref:non-specific serine/threonine protein kinase n=1 Tax=Streptosporangium carneum TaxID=47481 RepID=A0A9W6ME56_9ACTN|nr:serine/threonine protein kinase [Streptosporangium carneum]GLK10856.1 hypothetical protein GCM10017600_42620 [Streptosporangium carneum]